MVKSLYERLFDSFYKVRFSVFFFSDKNPMLRVTSLYELIIPMLIQPNPCCMPTQTQRPKVGLNFSPLLGFCPINLTFISQHDALSFSNEIDRRSDWTHYSKLLELKSTAVMQDPSLAFNFLSLCLCYGIPRM